nr:MAG TPA: hypothetical protein [Caudoviricetes sp.]
MLDRQVITRVDVHVTLTLIPEDQGAIIRALRMSVAEDHINLRGRLVTIDEQIQHGCSFHQMLDRLEDGMGQGSMHG